MKNIVSEVAEKLVSQSEELTIAIMAGCETEFIQNMNPDGSVSVTLRTKYPVKIRRNEDGTYTVMELRTDKEQPWRKYTNDCA